MAPMSRTGGRPIALWSAALALAVLLTGGIVFRRPIEEHYWLWKLKSTLRSERVLASEKLSTFQTTNAAQGLCHYLQQSPEDQAPSRSYRGISHGIVSGKLYIHLGFADGVNQKGERVSTSVEGPLHAATVALIHMGPPSVHSLVDLLKEKDYRPVTQAIYALGELGARGEQGRHRTDPGARGSAST
jgi:hypothetical protein